MSGSNRRSAPPSINLIEGFVMLSFKQSNLEYVSGNKSPLTSLRCFPSFKTRLTCHEHFDPYEKQNRGNPQHTPSTKPEPHLQMVTWTVLLAQIQVMRQTANAYPWKIRIVSNEQLLQEKHPTPAVSMVGSLGKIWLLSSGVKTVNSNATSQQPSEISTSHEFNQNVPHVTKRWKTTIALTHSDFQLRYLSTESHRIIYETYSTQMLGFNGQHHFFTSRTNEKHFSNRSIRAVLPRRSSANKLQMAGPRSLALQLAHSIWGTHWWLICRINLCHGLHDLQCFVASWYSFFSRCHLRSNVNLRLINPL